MTPSDAKEMLSLACELTAEAGKIILSRWGRASVEQKADGSPVTDADLAAEDYILGAIAKRLADHSVLSEERASRGEPLGESRHCWIVDPLDGTRNFTRGFPCFSTSIALVEDGVPVVGAVREHVTGRCYTAAASQGASIDGQAVRMVDRPLDRDFFVGGPSIKRDESPAISKRFIEQVNVRSVGCTSVSLALSACGGIDAAYGLRCYSWDIAAGYLLVREAGGVCTDIDGRELLPLPPRDDATRTTPFLASSPKAHAALLAMVRRALTEVAG